MFGHDWAAFTLRLRGVDITVIQVYLDCKIGGTGPNVVKLRDIAKHVMTTQQLFIIFGDFNMPPQQFLSAQFCELTKSAPVIVPGASASCRSGRMLEYAVASVALLPSITDIGASTY